MHPFWDPCFETNDGTRGSGWCCCIERHRHGFVLQTRRQTAAAAAAAAAADAAAGYNSDEEVYAAARAADGAAEGQQYDSDDNPLGAGGVDRKKIEPLPALDHASMEYDEFAKDFYTEHPALAALSPAEVGTGGQSGSRSCLCTPRTPGGFAAELLWSCDGCLFSRVAAGTSGARACPAQPCPALQAIAQLSLSRSKLLKHLVGFVQPR